MEVNNYRILLIQPEQLGKSSVEEREFQKLIELRPIAEILSPLLFLLKAI